MTTNRRDDAASPAVPPPVGGGGGLRPGSRPFPSPRPPPKDEPLPDVLFLPQIQHFKCRGVLRVGDRSGSGSGSGSSPPPESVPSDLCRGISTKLRTVVSMPLARTREEALRAFVDGIDMRQGVWTPPLGRMGTAGVGPEEMEELRARVWRLDGPAGAASSSASVDAAGGAGGNDSRSAPASSPPGSGSGDRLSCCGSTDVAVLTVREVPTSQFFPMPPMGGSAFEHFLNPFSILGRMGGMPPPLPGEGEGGRGGSSRDGRSEGSAPRDPFEELFGDPPSASSSSSSRDPSSSSSSRDPFAGGFGPFGPLGGLAGAGRLAGSGGSYKSVSTTSRMVDGKRVTTKETTTVVDGERRTIREITTVHPDGRREVVTEGNDDGGGEAKAKANAGAAAGASPAATTAVRAGGPPPKPKPKPEPPEALAVALDCRLGLERSVRLRDGGRSGRSETTVHLGPVGFKLASEYEVLEEDGAEEYAPNAATWDDGETKDDASASPRPPRQDQPKGERKDPMYYLSKTAEAMEQNAKAIYDVASEPGFPGRVVDGGRKVASNFGRTWERVGKAAGDVYRFWTEDDDDDDNGGGGGGNGGRGGVGGGGGGGGRW